MCQVAALRYRINCLTSYDSMVSHRCLHTTFSLLCTRWLLWAPSSGLVPACSSRLEMVALGPKQTERLSCNGNRQ